MLLVLCELARGADATVIYRTCILPLVRLRQDVRDALTQLHERVLRLVLLTGTLDELPSTSESFQSRGVRILLDGRRSSGRPEPSQNPQMSCVERCHLAAQRASLSLETLGWSQA